MAGLPVPEPPGFSELTKSEQIRYLQALWNRIAEHPAPESHLKLAEARSESYRRDPDGARPAHDVLDRLTKKSSERRSACRRARSPIWTSKQRSIGIRTSGPGLEFLDELPATYGRVVEGPFRYVELRSGIRRTLLRRFPYAVYFAVEAAIVVILAVLHAHRDPAE